MSKSIVVIDTIQEGGFFFKLKNVIIFFPRYDIKKLYEK